MISLEHKFCNAFSIQLENLYYEYLEFADKHNIEKDFEELLDIGEWQRLVTLDRLQGNFDGVDDSTFSESESALLYEAGKLISKGEINLKLSVKTNLDEARLSQIQAWNDASYLERAIGFGYHIFLLIISGGANDELAIILFRLACENFILIGQSSGESKSEIEKNARTALGKIGALARHKETYELQDQAIAYWKQNIDLNL